MDSLDLFLENPGAFYFVIILGLLVAAMVYGGYPLLYASFHNKPVAAPKYWWSCFLINLIPYFFLFRSSSIVSYMLWTAAFTAVGKNKLERRGLLIDPDAPPEEPPQPTEEPMEPQPAEAPAEPRYTAPAVEVIPAAPAAEPQPATHSAKHTGKFQQPAPVRKKSKQRYCRHCGSPLDPVTKQCTGCGRRPFRQTLRRFFSCLTLILSITVVCLCIYQTRQYLDQITQLTAQIDEQSKELQSLQSELATAEADATDSLNNYRMKCNEVYRLTQKNETLREQVSQMTEVYNFCNKHVVVVPNDGTGKYHKIQCAKFDASSFWVYSLKAAEQAGYTPCASCPDKYSIMRSTFFASLE